MGPARSGVTRFAASGIREQRTGRSPRAPTELHPHPHSASLRVSLSPLRGARVARSVTRSVARLVARLVTRSVARLVARLVTRLVTPACSRPIRLLARDRPSRPRGTPCVPLGVGLHALFIARSFAPATRGEKVPKANEGVSPPSRMASASSRLAGEAAGTERIYDPGCVNSASKSLRRLRLNLILRPSASTSAQSPRNSG